MSSTLYRKYRPARWADVAGQNHVKVTLAFEIATGKVAHAYLFSGPRGIGKTTTARIFAKAVNCEKIGKDGEPCGKCGSCELIAGNATLDVIEIDAASHRGIDAVRENIIENARFSPSKLRRKVFIIDEVHMMTPEAFNALLKTLEEPPKGVIFILATTEQHKVPATIVSRCQRFDFRRIPFADMVDRLRALCDDEKCKVDAKVLDEIARHSEGCLRDAEGLLGKVLAISEGKRVSYDQAIVVLPHSDYALAAQYVDALIRREARIALQTIGDCIDQGVDLDRFSADVTELVRKVLLTKMSGNPDAFAADLDEDRKQALSDWADMTETDALVGMLETLMAKQRDMKTAKPPQLPLELAAVMVCEGVSGAPRPAASAAMRPTAPVPAAKTAVSAPVRPPADIEDEIEAAVDASPATAPSGEEKPKVKEGVASGAARKDAAGDPFMSVARVREAWSDLVARAGEMSHSLTFLLSSAEPAEVVGDTLRIGFTFPFHRDKLNQDKVRMTVENACKGVFGCDVRVEGVLLEKTSGLGHSVSAPSSPAVGSSLYAEATVGATANKAAHAHVANGAGAAVPAASKNAIADLAAAFGGTVVE